MTAETYRASDPASVGRAVAILREGGVVGIPTETVYGIAVLPLQAALGRLVAIKRRSPDKGIALLIDSVEQVRDVAVVPPAAEHLADRFWPGPLTLVLDIRPGIELPELLTGGRPTIALRLPDHPVPRSLCRRIGRPIATSSANISGEPDATTPEQLLATLGEELALIVDDGPVRGGVPSTVVAVSEREPEPLILRHGALSLADIREIGG